MPPQRQPRPLPGILPWSSPWLFGNPNAPQGPNEPDVAYWLRRNLVAPVDPRNFGNWDAAVTRPAVAAGRAAVDTPAARAAFRQNQGQPGIADFARSAVEQVTARTQPQALGRQQQASPTPADLFQTNGWTLTSRPGDPRDGGRRQHQGYDFAPRNGDPAIRATQPFEVLSFRQAGLGGNTARVRFADGRVADFMHLAGPVPVGLRGGPGDVIGVAGRSGNATGTSTHVQMVQGAAAGSPAQAFGAGVGTAPPGMDAWTGYAGMALSEMDRAQAAANAPWSGSYQLPSAPQLPAPAHYQAPDFAAGNAAFEQARPQNPFAEPGSETRMLRQHFFRGMAEALLSVPTGRAVGFGELLMRAGAGALGGRMQGAEAVQRRQDRYDGLMQQYNLALASRNDQQATATANVINQNIELDNRHAYQQAAQNIEQFHRRNRVELQGNSVIVYREGEGGRQDVSVTPIPSLTAAHWGQLRAQVMLQGAGAAQQNAQWSWQQANTMALNYAALGIGQGGSTAAEGESLAYALGSVVVPLADSGMLPDLIGHDNYNQLRGYFEAANPVDPRQIMAPADSARRQAQMLDYIAQRVVRDAMGNPELARRLLGVNIGVAGRAVERVRSQRTTTSRGRRGVTTSTTYEASDE